MMHSIRISKFNHAPRWQKRFLYCILAAIAIIACFCTVAKAAPIALIINEPSLPNYSAPTVRSLQGVLKSAGYDVHMMTTDHAMQPGSLSADQCSLLVIPEGRDLPLTLIAPISQYVKDGGHVMALDAPLWKNSIVKSSKGLWVTVDELREERAIITPAHPLFDFKQQQDLASWTRTTNSPTLPTTYNVEPAMIAGRSVNALHTVISDLEGWDTYVSPPIDQPFANGADRMIFAAKGGPGTSALSIEWDEQDNSRWIAVVPLTTHWQGYALQASNFLPWPATEPNAAAGFQPALAKNVTVGMAFTHTGTVSGKHEYWIANIGTAPSSSLNADWQAPPQVPTLEALSPAYKFFEMHGPTSLNVPRNQGIGSPSAEGVLATGFNMSVQPRGSGDGYDKQRGWRQVPLVTAADARTGEWRGIPGCLQLWAPSSPYSGGAWASFGVDDPAFYQSSAMKKVLENTATRMRDGLFLIEGGAAFYTLFQGQAVRLGAQVADIAPTAEDASRSGVVKIVVTADAGQMAWQKSWPISVDRGKDISIEDTWTPPSTWPKGGYTVTTALTEKGVVVDRTTHKLSLYVPPTHPDYITTTPDGHFSLDGHLWRSFGVNYMPSSGIGVEDNFVFEHWLDRRAYDPDVIERDLAHIQDMGMTMVSVFEYTDSDSSQNLLDFLRRAANHHLHVNLSLRPVLDNYRDMSEDAGLAQTSANDRQIISDFQLAQNDTVFAYDVDWEPDFGNQIGRVRMDGDWRAWVVAKYGSVANAESTWGITGPRDASGALSNPTDEQSGSATGPATKMVIDYRHFLDGYLDHAYGTLRTNIKGVDPNHLVSFRMTETGNPEYPNSYAMNYTFQGVAHAVDFLSPEGYGRIGGWDKVRVGLFELAYARSAAPTLPVLWAEVGLSAADNNAPATTPESLAAQGKFIGNFMRMSTMGGADGVIFWWYPGGYRYGEGSDYGIINPDGTDRPSTVLIRQDGVAFLNAPKPPTPDVLLSYDRDAHADGIPGIYAELKKPFFDALTAGHHPGLKDMTAPQTASAQ